MKQPDPTAPPGGTQNVQAAKAALLRAPPARDAPPKPELPDFLAISLDALAASGLAILERPGSSARIDDGAAALLSVAGERAAADRHDPRASPAAGASAERDDTQADELKTSGPNAGQLMAAAHTIAVFLSAGSAAILDAAAETLAPRAAADSLSIRIAYVTPEGGHAAIGLSHPDLGELGIEVSLNARALSVIATAETERSAAAIREGQGALANKLAAQGINLQSLTVVVVNRRSGDRHSKTKRQEG